MYTEGLNLSILLSKDLLCALGPWLVLGGVQYKCWFIFPKEMQKALLQNN